MKAPSKIQSLKIKFPLYITILCILIGFILVFIFTSKNLSQLKLEYEKRATSIALNISNEIKYGLLTQDKQVMNQVVLPQLQQPDILYINIVGESGEDFISEYKQAFVKEIDSKLKSLALAAKKNSIRYSDDFVAEDTKIADHFVEASSPVFSNTQDLFAFDEIEQQADVSVNEKLGVVRIGISLSGLDKERSEMIKFSFSLSLAALLFSNLLAYFLAKVFVKPIIDVSYMASRVSRGELKGIAINEDENSMSFTDSSISLKPVSNDELGYLTSNFIQMTMRIKEHQNNLENEVELRTQELIHANKILMLYRHSIENTLDSVLILDNNASVIIANHAFVALSGFSEKNIKGKRIESFIASDELTSFANTVYPSLSESNEWHGKTFLQKSGGGKVPVELSISNIFDDNHEVIANVIIARDITERVHYEAELKKHADFDPLTGLYNRRRFHEELRASMARCLKQNNQLALLCIDLDCFKEINDSLGHQTGDNVLSVVATKLLGAARKGDIVARMGGDEFAMIVTIESKHEAVNAAERIVNELRHSQELPFKITCSIGVSIYPDNATTIEALMANADIAMYTSKNNGRNCFNLYKANSQIGGVNNLMLNQSIQDALVNDKFIFHMQPIVDAKTRETIHYELLLRLYDEHDQLIPPTVFIKHSEHTGVIKEIDRWVILNAIKFLANENAKGNRIGCAINLSAHTLNETALSDLIHQQLLKHNVEPAQLIIELTESAAISDFSRAQSFMNSLSDIGCRFALDDFGKGFTSFSYLKKLKVNYLKLDGSFIHTLANQPRDICIVEGVVKMAEGLDMQIIAEWVEDKETLQLLASLGVDFVQGYYTGRPLPAAQIINR